MHRTLGSDDGSPAAAPPESPTLLVLTGVTALFVVGLVVSEALKLFQWSYGYALFGVLRDVLIALLGLATFVALAGVTVWVARRSRSPRLGGLGLAALVAGGAVGVVVLPWPGAPQQNPAHVTITLTELAQSEFAVPAVCRDFGDRDTYFIVVARLGDVGGGALELGLDLEQRPTVGVSVLWQPPQGATSVYGSEGATVTVATISHDGTSGELTFSGLSLEEDPPNSSGPIGGTDGPRTLSGSVAWECET